MKQTEDGSEGDPRLARAMEEYQALLAAGKKPDHAKFLARYPEVAGPLADGLAGLDLLHAAAPNLVTPAADSTRAAGLDSGAELGDFRLIREVGRGGMGVVYEAEQISLRRRVALKVLSLAGGLDPRQLQRFHNEARAAARLHHTHIAPVYADGCERGVHYYAMQFIDGRTLADLIDEQRGGSPSQAPTTGEAEARAAAAPAPTVPPAAQATSTAPRDAAHFRRVAEWGIQAAEALDYAHTEGIIHRDVKPGNLMLDAAGRLWVTDFGLAQVQNDTRLTMTGNVVGTLRYMSPEQAEGQNVLIDHRTDIYSLGATLYELLTLVPAFPGTDRQVLLRQVALDDPKPPRRIDPDIPAELETLVLKAMAKESAERYATARDLADDLGRFLRDEPIKARRPTLVQRARKFSRRHKSELRIVTGAVAIILVLLVVGYVFLLVQRGRKAQDDLADSHERTARSASQRGDWRQVIDSCDKALATDRYRASIPLRLIKLRALFALDDAARFAPEIKALADTPNLGEYEGAVLLLQADFLLGRDDAEAERLIRRAEEKGLSPAEGAYAQALMAETTPEAVRHLQRSLELDPYQPRARTMLALLLILLGRLPDARLELTDHEARFPGDVNAKLLRSQLIALEGDLETANAVLDRLGGQLENTDMKALRALVRLYSELRNPANPLDPIMGIPDLRRHLLTLVPVGLWPVQAGDGPEAFVAAYDSFLRRFPLPPRLRRILISVLHGFGPTTLDRFGRLDARTVDEITAVTKVHPEGTLLYIRALALLGCGQFDEAEKAALTAAETPALFEIRQQALLVAATAAGLPYVSEKVSGLPFVGASTMGLIPSPLGPGPLLAASALPPGIRENPDQLRRAIEHLRKALALGPVRIPTRRTVAVLLAIIAREFSLARQLLDDWERQAPTDAQAAYFRAITELRAGAYGLAWQAADKALKGKLDNASIRRMKEVKEEATEMMVEQALPFLPPSSGKRVP